MLIFKVVPASINPSVPIFITHLPLYSIFQHPLRPKYVPQVDKSKDVSFSTAFLRFSCTLFSKYEAEIEIERERGRDKDLDISRIEKWFYIIKQIEVITAAYPQSTNCAHSASLWCQRLQTVADDLITVSQWCKCCRAIVAIHKPFSWMQSSEKSETALLFHSIVL